LLCCRFCAEVVPTMQPGGKNFGTPTNKPLGSQVESGSSPRAETREEMNERLLGLLGEVIRMSQAWVRALESGDPFTAEKCEDECIRAMERFEANRKTHLARLESFENTQ
jgi:hypothetical protein